MVCIACTALVKSYAGLVVCRFFLGITEAPFYPGATYMLSIFYTRKGKPFSRVIFPAVLMVNRGRCSYCRSLLRADSRHWLLWSYRRWCLCRHGWSGWSRRMAMVRTPLPPTLSLYLIDFRLFIVEGAATAVVAIAGFFMLPNTPLTTRWLTDREKQLAHERMEKDKVSDSQEGGSSWEGLKQACSDKRTWLFCLMQNFHLSACSFNSFFPT